MLINWVTILDFLVIHCSLSFSLDNDLQTDVSSEMTEQIFMCNTPAIKSVCFLYVHIGTSLVLTRPALTCSSPAASSAGPEKPSTCIFAASLHAATRLSRWYVVYTMCEAGLTH